MMELQCYRCQAWPCKCPDGITLIHGDCREVLPWLEAVDLVLTDPPWGVDHDTSFKKSRSNRPYDRCQVARGWKPCIGDDKPFDPMSLLTFQNLIIWGANHFADKLPPSSFWLCWDRKTDKGADSTITDCELAWVRGRPYRTTRMFRHMWAGFQRDSQAGDKHLHPMEKPVALMQWCLSLFPRATAILDPYMGSGPVLVAAKLSGRRAIGIEIEERYCRIAANRLRQGVLI